MKNLVLAVFAGALLTAAGCDKKSSSSAPAAPAAPAALAPAAAPAPAAPAAPSAALLDPRSATAQAPETYRAKFSTTKGDFVIEVRRAWAPHGADRFYNLVKIGYFDGCEFFRVVDGFMAQVGIHGDPAVNQKWHDATIPDDPSAGQTNARGMVTFATAGPNTRTTQFFLNFRDNSFLDAMGFPPFGKVVEGAEVLDKLYRGYGDGPPQGAGPNQGQLQAQGNAYLKAQFPNLDAINSAKILP